MFCVFVWSPFAARPLALLDGVRFVLGPLPCPGSVFAFAGASSAC